MDRPLEIESGYYWYLLQTKPCQERAVERRLKDLHLEVFLPWLRCKRRIGSQRRWVLAPLFPGYVFCRLDMVLAGKAARYAPGVRDFVKFGPRVAQVSEEVIEALVERCPGGIAAVAMRPYRPGETIAIKEGPFAGLEAMFEREMADSERVAVLIEILGRQTRLVLASEMVGRA